MQNTLQVKRKGKATYEKRWGHERTKFARNPRKAQRYEEAVNRNIQAVNPDILPVDIELARTHLGIRKTDKRHDEYLTGILGRR